MLDFFKKKKATADIAAMHRIFTVPEEGSSTLYTIEKEISRNLHGFLERHVISGDIPPHELEKDFTDTTIFEDPIFVSEQADFLLSKLVAQSVNTSSPEFIGHMTSALPYFMLPLAKIMMALNQNLVKIETSKAFTPLERQVIGMLHRLVFHNDLKFYDKNVQDRDHALGTFCSGGTVANMTALWVARNRMLGPKDDFLGVATVGLPQAMVFYGYRDLAVLVSRMGHYSLSKASDLLGIGKRQLISVNTDRHYKVSVPELEQHIRRLTNEGVGIQAIVGIAGTTETGNVDPLDELADLAKQHQIHFHVDAAWGGPTLFSDRHRSILKGIEQADSVAIDAHKQLYVPIGAGICLFREETALNAIEQKANYVIRSGSRDLGKRALEGSRPGMAMLVHSGLRIIGRKGYELLIDQGIEKAEKFASIIAGEPDFELISAPELNLLTYRYVPEDIRQELAAAQDKDQISVLNQKLNSLTIKIQRAQRTGGRTFVSRTRLFPEKYHYESIDVFRVVLANPLTTDSILRKVIDEQREHAKRFLTTEDLSAALPHDE